MALQRLANRTTLLLSMALAGCGKTATPSVPTDTLATLTIAVSGSGTTLPAAGTSTHPVGTVVQVTATAANGHHFAGWSGAAAGTANPVSITMSGDQSLTASFAQDEVAPKYLVAMVQASQAQATDLGAADVASLVSSAVAQAGGLGFVHDGQTVILKPNLVNPYTDGSSKLASQTVNGITTDWRVTKAVADLVRARNPTGRILVMEGSTIPTARAYSLLGYTAANFGGSVDEFVSVEGDSCIDRATTALVQRTARSGRSYWVNGRYATADVVISLPTLKTHKDAGITGAVKNLAIGMTPVGQYSSSTGKSSTDCTRGQNATYIDHSSPEVLGQFIRDYFAIRPADFVVMDALQGLEHGPSPVWEGADYASSRKNMRLVLAGRNAVAVDTIASLVMMCDPKKVPHLTLLAADGLGTTDATEITVVGKQVSEVATPFAGKVKSICPGTTARRAGACQAGVSYPTPVLGGAAKLVYRPSTAGAGTYEGPVWLAGSSELLFSDMTFTGPVNPSQILRATPAGAVTTYLADAGTNGMAVDGGGAVFACSHKLQAVVKLDRATGTFTPVASGIEGKKFNSPNDLVVRSDGTIFFTDPDFQLGNRASETGRKGVYRVSPSGAVSLVDGTFTEPNGIALSPDETVLYVADNAASAVHAFTVAADGTTSGRRRFATVSSPDGFAVDCLGNLYVASGSSGTVQVFDASGKSLGSITAAPSVSNVAFGGVDGKTLYITAGKALYSYAMNLPGYFD